MSNFNPEELIAEKNLWDIYRKSRRIPNGSFSKNIAKPSALFLFTLLLIYAFISPHNSQ